MTTAATASTPPDTSGAAASATVLGSAGAEATKTDSAPDAAGGLKAEGATANADKGEALKTEGEAKKEEPAEAAAATDWDKWEAKVPDGFKADAELLGKAKPLFKELGLKAEGAQKLVDLFTAAETAKATAVQAEMDGWKASVAKDKELGGANEKATLEAAKRALAKFGSPELSKFFDDFGVGNHPEFLRFVARVGKALAEDSVAGRSGAAAAGASNNNEARLRAQYPTMFPAQE